MTCPTNYEINLTEMELPAVSLRQPSLQATEFQHHLNITEEASSKCLKNESSVTELTKPGIKPISFPFVSSLG